MYKVIKEALTKENNKIFLYETDNSDFQKRVLIIGVFHGEEPQGEYLINKFMKQNIHKLKNKLYIIPCLNPDGKKKNVRQNSSGVDLNRNFPTGNWKKTEKNEYFGGEFPESEIETRFMTEILNTIDFDAILSIHAPFGTVNFDGPAKELAEKISNLTRYPVQEDIGYPTPGSFGTYAGIEKNIPVITLELPEGVSDNELWNVNKSVFDYFAFEY